MRRSFQGSRVGSPSVHSAFLSFHVGVGEGGAIVSLGPARPHNCVPRDPLTHQIFQFSERGHIRPLFVPQTSCLMELVFHDVAPAVLGPVMPLSRADQLYYGRGSPRLNKAADASGGRPIEQKSKIR